VTTVGEDEDSTWFWVPDWVKEDWEIYVIAISALVLISIIVAFIVYFKCSDPPKKKQKQETQPTEKQKKEVTLTIDTQIG
jgi:flagellar biosynthesis/type III secretory pathway M-ring protein FliF/YscJ